MTTVASPSFEQDRNRRMVRRPLILPHYTRRGEDVFFLLRREPVARLSPTDIPLFQAINGRRSGAELVCDFPAADLLLQDWTRRHLLVWLPSARPSCDAPHIIVIEPHMDDAMLSVGGALLKMCGSTRISILSIVRWSTYTSYVLQGRSDFADLECVTNLRTEESRIAAQMIGGEHLALDEYDAPLLPFQRADRTVDTTAVRLLMNESRESMSRRERHWAASVALGITPDHTRHLVENITTALEPLTADEIWLPLGVGHVDHVKVRRACLTALLAQPSLTGARQVVLYKDIPYCTKFAARAALLESALNDIGLAPDVFTIDISDVWAAKLEALSIYASQWKIDHLAPLIPASEGFVRITLPPPL